MNLDQIDVRDVLKRERLAEEYRRECQAESRHAEFRLLSRSESNTKIKKSMRIDYRIFGLSLSHHRSAGSEFNVCPQATAACSAVCVATSGLSKVFPMIEQGRQRKTRFLFTDRKRFLRQFTGEIQTEIDIAERLSAIPVLRSNVFSDCDWHTEAFGMIPQIFRDTPLRIYDYTKCHRRCLELRELGIENWHLTPSWSELKRHQDACLRLLSMGFNVSMVFRDQLPGWMQLDNRRVEVFSGDNGTGPGCDPEAPHYDLRFLDPKATRSGYGRVCGLSLKGSSNHVKRVAVERGFAVVQ